jgi:hypothetical protein
VLDFDAPRDAAAQARRFVSAQLGDVGTGVVDDARSVVTELVVEALSRGRMPRNLSLGLGPRHLRLELRAEGRLPPLAVVTDRRASQELVERLCVSSGSRPLGDGRRWWAVLDRQPPQEPGQAG